MTIEESLIQRFGPLLSLAHLAAILDRSPDGLRVSLRSGGDWASKVNQARLKIGRRVYFRTSHVAAILSDESFGVVRG
jgi:hypothetical protein